MANPVDTGSEWIEELVRFLRTQPGVSAVRIDPSAHRVAVATVGAIDLTDFEEKLAATIAAIEAHLAARDAGRAPAGYSLRQDGSATVVGRDSCVTAEKMWLWREMKWPEIKAEPSPEDQEWRTLAVLAAVCAVAGIAGTIAGRVAPALPLVAKGFFLAGLIAGGWDAAIDTWANLKKREIDIHFLMLAVAIGAMCIGAWGEAVLLLFLFSASGAMEEYALDRTQREVSSLLKSSPKRATIVLANGREQEIAVEHLQLKQRVRVKPGEAFAADG